MAISYARKESDAMFVSILNAGAILAAFGSAKIAKDTKKKPVFAAFLAFSILFLALSVLGLAENELF